MVPIILQVRLTFRLSNTKFWLPLFIVIVLLSILVFKLKPDEELKGLLRTNDPAEEEMAKTINLQDEINQASNNGGGIVTVPKGVFTVDETIILKSNVHLKGAGMGETTIRLNLKKSKGNEEDSTILKTEHNAQNIQITDMTFDGEKNKRKKQINDSYSHTVVLQFVDGFEISRVEVIRSPSASIMLFNSRNGLVNNSKIKDGGSNGIIGLQKTENVEIINNEIDHTDHQNGIFISYQEGKSSNNVTIEGNKVKDAGDFGIEVGHLVEAGEEQHVNITVRDNVVTRSRNAGIAFRTVSDGVIEDNIIKGYGKTGGYGGDAIFVEGWKNQSVNVKVSNNIIEQTYQTGDANAIYVTGMVDTIIENNEVKGSRGKGLFVQASVIGEETGDFPEGIRLFNQLAIRGNKIYKGKMEGIHLQGYKAEGISITNNDINHNLAAGLVIANLNVMSRGLVVRDNIIKDNGLAGIDMYSQEDFVFEGNRLINNGQKAKDIKNRSAIVLFNVGNGLLRKNTYEEGQKVPTQKYYLQIAELTGQVTQQDAEFIGLTPQLGNSTDDYLE